MRYDDRRCRSLGHTATRSLEFFSRHSLSFFVVLHSCYSLFWVVIGHSALTPSIIVIEFDLESLCNYASLDSVSRAILRSFLYSTWAGPEAQVSLIQSCVLNDSSFLLAMLKRIPIVCSAVRAC